MPRRGGEIGYLNPQTMEWVKTGEADYPCKDAIAVLPTETLDAVMLEIAKLGEEQ